MNARGLALATAVVVSATFAVHTAFGSSSGPSLATPTIRPATFQVGAAVELINPMVKVDLGGYAAGPDGGTIRRHVNPLTSKLEDLTVRAIAIASPTKVVEMASIDGQGSFASYLEGPFGLSDMRAAVATFLQRHGRPLAVPSDIIISTLHEHAVPALYGIYAPYAFNLGYLKQVYAQTVTVLEEAYLRAAPATVSVGTANAPWLGGGNIAEGNSFEGWPTGTQGSSG